jgi:hypothetical protein
LAVETLVGDVHRLIRLRQLLGSGLVGGTLLTQ